ncbi:hypothetical protein GCM10023178_65480 [Actinomadura luteofluorescens]
MEGKLAELGDAALVEHLAGVLVVAQRQQRREVPGVLLEEVEDGGDPAFAEPHPGPDALRLQLVRAGVGGLLEQGDAGLVPEPVPEQER